MNSLTELYNNALVPLDAELEKQASAELQKFAQEEAEIMKIAEEQDAAGRIMARGFADELNKLAAIPAFIKEKMKEKEDEDEDEDEKKQGRGKGMKYGPGQGLPSGGWRPGGGVAARQRSASNVGGGTYKKPTDVTLTGKYKPGAAKAKPMPKVTSAPKPGNVKMPTGPKARPM